MKKLTLLGTLLFASSVAMAGFQQSPAVSQGANVISVSKALSAKDKSVIVLEGNIQRQIDEDEFIFTDGTATIKVEIDEHVWRGVDVSSQDKIRLIGIVDKDIGRNAELEVTEVQKLK